MRHFSASTMIIAIVTPTLNAAEYLTECILSVKANQIGGATVHHIIVDGGSTDGTIGCARAHGLEVLSLQNHSIFDKINIGSRSVQADLVGVLGGDDLLLPGAIEAVAESYHASVRRWLVGGIQWIDENDRDLGSLAAPPEWMTPRMCACLGWNPIMSIATFFRRDFFDELGGYDPSYAICSDYDLYIRALQQEPFARIDQRLGAFRRTGLHNSIVKRKVRREEYLKIIEQYGPSTNSEQLFWRLVMKNHFNLRNPGWMARKMWAAALYQTGFEERMRF